MTQHNHHHQDHQAHSEQSPVSRKRGDGDAHAGHDKHAGHSAAGFRDKFWLTLLLTIPTLIWSGMIQHWFDYTAPQFPGAAYIPAMFGTVVYFYGGSPFLRGGYQELRSRLPGMMTLISLAITVAFVYSAVVTLGLVEGLDLWWELATLVAIMLLGHWIEMRSINQAQGALKELAKLLPDMAVRFDEAGTTKEIPVAELRRGDLLLIRPGASIPADGVVKEGTSAVNEAMITGESKRAKADGQVGGRPGDRRHRQRTGLAACRSDGDRRRDGTRGHHAARRTGPDVALARPGPGGSRGVLPHDHRHRLRRHHRYRLATPGPTVGLHDRARSDGSRDRLPPCAGSGHPAGDRHLDHDRRTQRPARARSTRPRRGPSPVC